MLEEDIVSKNVILEKYTPIELVKVGKATSSLKTDIGNKDLKKNNRINKPSIQKKSSSEHVKLSSVNSNMHDMPSIDLSHKACNVVNCMSCAFNVMSTYFKSMHATSDKTAHRQHVNNKKHVKPKTAIPPQVWRKTFVPKPKQKVVMAVYKVKYSVSVKEDNVKVKNVVLPDKGQFFKYAGPNQSWVPKKV